MEKRISAGFTKTWNEEDRDIPAERILSLMNYCQSKKSLLYLESGL